MNGSIASNDKSIMVTSILEPNEGYVSDSVISSFDEQEMIINDINVILKKIFIYHSLNYCQQVAMCTIVADTRIYPH